MMLMLVGRQRTTTTRTTTSTTYTTTPSPRRSAPSSLRRHPMTFVTAASAVFCWGHLSSFSSIATTTTAFSFPKVIPTTKLSYNSRHAIVLQLYQKQLQQQQDGYCRRLHYHQCSLQHEKRNHDVVVSSYNHHGIFVPVRSTTSTTRRYSSNEMTNDPTTTTTTDNNTHLSSSYYTHLPRIYIESSNNNNNNNNKNNKLALNTLVSLSSAQSHYLQTVMRLSNTKRWGDLTNHIRIFNGQDGEWLAKLLLVTEDDGSSSSSQQQQQQQQRRRSKKAAKTNYLPNNDEAIIAQCVKCLIPQPLPLPYHITLWIPSLKKKERRKWLLEKVTELGISAIGFIQTDYSENSIGGSGDVGGSSKNKYKSKKRSINTNFAVEEEDNNNNEYYKIRTKDVAYIVEAAEQCERLTIPKLLLPSLEEEEEEKKEEEAAVNCYVPKTLSDIIEKIWERKNNNKHNKNKDHMDEDDNTSNTTTDNNNNNNNTSTKVTTTSCWLICRERSPSSCSIFQALQNMIENNQNKEGGDDVVCTTSTTSTTSTTDSANDNVPYDIHILVGPEGGWSPTETQQIEDAIQYHHHHHKNTHHQDTSSSQSSPNNNNNSRVMILQSVTLGPMILRAETAAITAVGATMLHQDDYSNNSNNNKD